MSAVPQQAYTLDQIVLKREEKRRQRRKSNPDPTFRGAILEGQSATDHEMLLSGPAETGKTYGGLWKLDTLLRETPKARAALVRKVRQDMGATVLQTWERIVAIRGDVQSFGGAHPEWYEYPNGSRLYVAGMDRPGKVLSGELDFIYVNQAEEFQLDAWETLATRSTGRGAVTDHPQLFGDCNPGPPSHWILKRPSLRILHSKHTDNPTLYADDGTLTAQGKRTMEILDSLTGVRRERLYLGRWVAAEGVVYDFDRSVHLIPRFEIPADWRRIRVIDFGFSNAFVCSWYAIDPDGRAYRYREIYRTQRIVEDHAKDIVRLSRGENIEATVADHDAEDRATLERHGVRTIPAEKSISPGIQAVQARLRVAGDGKPRLFFLEGSLVERDETLAAAHKPVCTEDEFEVYVWPKDSTGRALKEEPVKQNDHGCFVAGTMIETPTGQRAIETLAVEDLVLTRNGIARVCAAGLTDPAASLWHVRFSDGTTLTGTANHPIHTLANAFVPLYSLRYGDSVTSCRSAQRHPSRSSYSTASRSADTLVRNIGRTAPTLFRAVSTASMELVTFIEKSGRRLTGLFQQGMRSITSMAMPVTMIPATSPAYQRQNILGTIPRSTPRPNERNGDGGLPEFGHSLSTGTAQKREGAGIASTHTRWRPRASDPNSPVNSAEGLIWHSRRQRIGSAPITASLRSAEGPALMTSSWRAGSVAANSSATDTPRPDIAPARVLSVRELKQRGAVYNLTIAGAPEYFANGILVHNCDALRYAIAYLDIAGAQYGKGFDAVFGETMATSAGMGAL